MYNTNFYRKYASLHQRIYDKNCHKYVSYGGRGIRCEWKSFEEFRDDMYKSYLVHCKKFGEKDTSLERIDNNGNYCKENCKWIRLKEQALNRRNNNKLEYKGQAKNIGDWEKYLGICRGLILYRLKKGKTFKEIINIYGK